jgi:hypothetical protein
MEARGCDLRTSQQGTVFVDFPQAQVLLTIARQVALQGPVWQRSAHVCLPQGSNLPHVSPQVCASSSQRRPVYVTYKPQDPAHCSILMCFWPRAYPWSRPWVMSIRDLG